jgi:hypothetical protein
MPESLVRDLLLVVPGRFPALRARKNQVEACPKASVDRRV